MDDNDDNDDNDKLPNFQRPLSNIVGELGIGTVMPHETAQANER